MSHAPALPPVWVISLAASESRRRTIAARLEQLEVGFEFVEATDGATLTRDTLGSCYDPAGALALTGSQLALGQIGASLSHMALWRRMLDEGVDEAVILEDDAHPTDEFVPVLRSRDRLAQGCELLLLYYGPTLWSIWRQAPITRLSRSIRFVSGAAGTVGYLLKRSAARKFLDAGQPIRVPVDYLTGGWVKTGVCRLGVQPRCVEHRDGHSTRSTQLADIPITDDATPGQPFDRIPDGPGPLLGLLRRINPYYSFAD